MLTAPVREFDYNFTKHLSLAEPSRSFLSQKWTSVSPMSHVSCAGDILTPAQSWARIVNSRFSMPKHYHVFSVAEACKRCWLGVGVGVWVGVGVGAWLRLFQLSGGRSLSQPGVGGLWPGHCWRDYPCIKHHCRHLSHSFSLSLALCLSLFLQPTVLPLPSIPHLSFPQLLLCNELPLFTS